MTLSSALNSATSGLSATAFRADIASNNIANANTPGYVRRTAIVSENTIAGTGAGTRISGVQRNVNEAITADRRQAEAATGRAQLVSDTYNLFNRRLGEPDDPTGLFAAYQSLETSLRSLSQSPESPALQNQLYTSANNIVLELNGLSNLVIDQRTKADKQIAEGVDRVNKALNEVKQLNADISSLNEASGEAAALEDRRQQVIDEISNFIPVKQLDGGNGTVNLITQEGVFLLAGNVRPIEFNQANLVAANDQYANGTGSLSGLTVDGQNITPGSTSSFAAQSGEAAGLFAIRDKIAPEFNQRVDAIAADLISRFSEDSLDTTKPAGAPGIFTDAGNALDTLNTTGVAGRLRLNAAVDPTKGGVVSRFRDGLGATTEGPQGNAAFINQLLDKLTAREPTPNGAGLTGSLSSLETVAGVTSFIGDERIRSDAVLNSAKTRFDLLNDAEIAQTGVDTDQELQSLLLIEQAYAANARVIQTLSQMINKLLEI